jgi:hypothetical protein
MTVEGEEGVTMMVAGVMVAGGVVVAMPDTEITEGHQCLTRTSPNQVKVNTMR